MGTLEYAKIEYLNVLPFYLESAVSSTKPFFHTDLKNSLEDIVLKEKPENEKDLIGKVFSDKGKSLKATIKALFSEISLREQLNSHLLERIDQDMCRQNTYLMNLIKPSFSYSSYLSKEISNTKNQLTSRILDLEEEKRKEYLECWRDLMFLKKYLFMALKDYWDLSKRREALSSDIYKTIENDKSKGY